MLAKSISSNRPRSHPCLTLDFGQSQRSISMNTKRLLADAESKVRLSPKSISRYMISIKKVGPKSRLSL